MAETSKHLSALVLYGSETGNAQDVAEELGRVCERLRFDVRISDLNSTPLNALLQFNIVLIAISTAGQGDLPANAQQFWKSLRSVKLPPQCLSTIKFASFGLGDSSYPKFNYAHRKLYNRLVQLGAAVICERGESDEQHADGIDGTFIAWGLKLREELRLQFPSIGEVQEILDDKFLEPKWRLALATDLDSNIESETVMTNGSQPQTEDLPRGDLLQISSGLEAKVISNERLTPSKHWQDVRLLRLELNGKHSYQPGDVLTLYPKNFPSDVNRLISLMDWDDVADQVLIYKPNKAYGGTIYAHDPLRLPFGAHSLTLRALLESHLDIMSIPRRSFFSAMKNYTNDDTHLERLNEFTDPALIDELYTYTTRPRRSILEVLQDFPSVKIPWQHVCSVFPAIRGRQFSIASGGDLKGASPASTTVELLVAIVKYRTIMRRVRNGVCTRYVAALQPGQSITVTLQSGGLGIKPDDIHRPIVMIGPGTGVAPMRALIHQRSMQRRQSHVGEPETADILIFGCRNKDADYFFEEEWETIQRQNGLQMFTAFSRDQSQKVYVQDVVLQQAKAIVLALTKYDGLFFVCGSSGKMPQAVREALVVALQQERLWTRETAENYVVRLEKENRYKQETW